MVYFLCKAYDSDRQNCYFAQSLPVRGAWIEICRGVRAARRSDGSLPVRGAWIEIASGSSGRPRRGTSLPVRGAWIEIVDLGTPDRLACSRSPCGERGLKYSKPEEPAAEGGRSPCGERGLKSFVAALVRRRPCRSPCGERGLKSLLYCAYATKVKSRSPCGERGLKSWSWLSLPVVVSSLPVRGAWIEMSPLIPSRRSQQVAPRAGSVD